MEKATPVTLTAPVPPKGGGGSGYGLDKFTHYD